METYAEHTSKLYNKMLEELQIFKTTAIDLMELTDGSIKIVKRVITMLRKDTLEQGFSGDDEEINFFKVTKPLFYKHLIYYTKIWQLGLNQPVGKRKSIAKFFSAELDKLRFFYRKHRNFYSYYRSGANNLDHLYFLRSNHENFLQPEDIEADKDKECTTSHDHIVAKMLANDMLVEHLSEELDRLKKINTTPTESSQHAMLWTGSKASLTELLYALYSTGVFNQGNISLQQLASFLEQIFKVKLGNYYRAFQEIRIRKKNRTQFLDELKMKLIQKMDYDDEHPRY